MQLIGENKPKTIAAVGHGYGFCWGNCGGNNDYNRNNAGGGGNGGKVCSHCGRIRHTVETCYRKHGFPPNLSSEIQDPSIL